MSASTGKPPLKARHLLALALLPITLYLTANALTGAVLALTNTLNNNGNWICSKEQLANKVMGSPSYVRSTQALAGEHLHLDAWHGYQEVITRERLRLSRATFDFHLEPGAYLAFVLHDNDGFSGIRISAHPSFPSITFRAEPGGQFLEQHPLTLPEFPTGNWNHAEFHADAEGVRLLLNGVAIPLPAFHVPPFCQPGFRAGERPAAIDNVLLAAPDRVLLEDTFTQNQQRPRYLLAALIVLTLLSLIVQYSQTLAGVPLATSLLATTLMNTGLALLALLTAPFLPAYLALYPSRESMLRFEAAYLYNLWDWRSDEIITEAQAAKAESKDLLLFIGSSQTFGAGASRPGEDYVSVIQQRLHDTLPGGAQFRCINAGINGTGTPTLLPYHRDHWLALNPKLVIIDLAINDRWNPDEEFAANLRAMIQLNQEHNIKTLLLVEPHSSEWMIDDAQNGPGELSTHAIVRQVAAQTNTPLIDTHQRLHPREQDGFLWWDFVHPTTFGHRALAETILPELSRLLTE
jgi:lysophospholipase L1-like esterase